MGLSNIAKANSIRKLLLSIKTIPIASLTALKELLSLKTNEERLDFLKKLPEDTLRYLLKVLTYLILSTGVLAKESLHEIYLTPEIQVFFDKVNVEIEKAGKLTMETVSIAVDIVLGTMAVATTIGLIAAMTFLILNPPVAAAVAGASIILSLVGCIGSVFVENGEKNNL